MSIKEELKSFNHSLPLAKASLPMEPSLRWWLHLELVAKYKQGPLSQLVLGIKRELE